MIIIAHSDRPAQPRRRTYPHGMIPPGTAGNWITGYMGRELRDANRPIANAALPTAGQIYPMAYLVEQDPNSSLRPHFHIADQFQVFVAGDGHLGTVPLEHVALQFVAPYSAYGPIDAGPRGIQYVTLRNRFDPGSRFMPDSQKELPRPRRYRQVIVAGPVKPVEPAQLAAFKGRRISELIVPEEDGLGAWHFRLPPREEVRAPDPGRGDGQHWLVLGGGLVLGSEVLPRNSCVFVSADEAAPSALAGPAGLECLVLQYPKRRPEPRR